MITFPLGLDFFDSLNIESTTFRLPAMVETTETAGGEIVTSSYGPRLWAGKINVRPDDRDAADQVYARAELLLEPGASFLVTQSTRFGPQSDIEGVILGSATPTIASVATNNRVIGLAGVPAGYKLTRGDLLSFIYGGRYALHRVQTGGVANGSGALTGLEVTPAIRPTLPVGTSVQLVRPICKAVMVPDSLTEQVQLQDPMLTNGFSFEWRQTLR